MTCIMIVELLIASFVFGSHLALFIKHEIEGDKGHFS